MKRSAPPSGDAGRASGASPAKKKKAGDTSSGTSSAAAAASGGRLRLPDKIMKYLNEGPIPDVLWWNPDGNGFSIDSDTVQGQFLDEYCQGIKLSSLIRNLNRWGFRRVFYPDMPQTALAFQHPMFKKSNPGLLKSMKMEAYGVPPPDSSTSDSGSNSDNEKTTTGEEEQATAHQRQLEARVQEEHHRQAALHETVARQPHQWINQHGEYQQPTSLATHPNNIVLPPLPPQPPQHHLLQQQAMDRTNNVNTSTTASPVGRTEQQRVAQAPQGAVPWQLFLSQESLLSVDRAAGPPPRQAPAPAPPASPLTGLSAAHKAHLLNLLGGGGGGAGSGGGMVSRPPSLASTSTNSTLQSTSAAPLTLSGVLAAMRRPTSALDPASSSNSSLSMALQSFPTAPAPGPASGSAPVPAASARTDEALQLLSQILSGVGGTTARSRDELLRRLQRQEQVDNVSRQLAQWGAILSGQQRLHLEQRQRYAHAIEVLLSSLGQQEFQQQQQQQNNQNQPLSSPPSPENPSDRS